ncbi:unnamed protein product [Rhizophagus irregularis]|nr:unnamed protein product [Rhizophagus irregularis]
MAQHSTKLESNLSQTNFSFYDIAMEIHIGNYLDSNNYTNWSTLGLLQYLVEKENYTTVDATNIHNAFRCHLEKKSADHNMFKYARNKAERLARTLDLAEVTQFFNLSPQVQEQDQRAQNQEYQWAQRQQDQRIQPQRQFIQTLIHDYSTLYEQKQHCDLKIRIADTQVFELPDVSPQCFKTLLNYMYSGNICLEDYKKSEIFDLYFVAMKFNLKEIVTTNPSYVLDLKSGRKIKVITYYAAVEELETNYVAQFGDSSNHFSSSCTLLKAKLFIDGKWDHTCKQIQKSTLKARKDGFLR